MIKQLSLIIISSSVLFAGTVKTPTINKLLDYKKDMYLKKYNSKDIKKPVKKAYPKFNIAEKDMFESTKEYNKRVKNSKQVLELKKRKLDKDFTLQLKKYDSKIKKKDSQQKEAKKKLPEILTNSLGDIVNIYLGKPSIKDFNTYNADDEVFITSIVSKNLTIPVQIQIPKELAKKLYIEKKVKDIKPIVTFEYSDNSLYISEVKAVYKKQTFNTMPNTPQYDKTFQLNHKLNDIFFTWQDKKILDKDIVNYPQYEKKYEKKRLAKLKKEKLKKAKLDRKKLSNSQYNIQKKTTVNLELCKSCHGQNFELSAFGQSKIVSNMTRDEVSRALVGYKNGTYGGSMKGIMQSQVLPYKEEELRTTGLGRYY